jgi:uncharacterized tellurite resistance protein B-like protein
MQKNQTGSEAENEKVKKIVNTKYEPKNYEVKSVTKILKQNYDKKIIKVSQELHYGKSERE